MPLPLTKDHFLVPKHYFLPKEEAEKTIAGHGFRREQMPMIQKNDPAIKEMKPQKGDIIKIVRNSQTAGKTIYYRVVV
jgi:DNA-directed RNA polymerase subunit H